MPDTILPASPEEDDLLGKAFLQAVLPTILNPSPVTRFTLSNSLHGPNPMVAFGNAVLVQIPNLLNKTPLTNVVCAITFDKKVAEDLVVRLEQAYRITEEDRKAALERNRLPDFAAQ